MGRSLGFFPRMRLGGAKPTGSWPVTGSPRLTEILSGASIAGLMWISTVSRDSQKRGNPGSGDPYLAMRQKWSKRCASIS
jgi:hypothetical protein